MDERDLEAEHPAARRLVDQLGARAREVGQRRANVVDLVRDVVHSRPALREEAADRSVLAERAEELDAALADADRRSLDSLLLDPLAMLERPTEEARICVDRAVEVVDGDSDMVDRARRGHAPIVCERARTPTTEIGESHRA